MNLLTGELADIPSPLKRPDGFEWTENFDFLSITNNYYVYFNLKFVVGAGGAQTRSLREAYHFVKCQLTYPPENIIFINILDGDEAYKSSSKLRYLYLNCRVEATKFFIGDMAEFLIWFKDNPIFKMAYSSKKELGQFYTTNYAYILQGIDKPLVGSTVVEPFAGNGTLLEFLDKSAFTIEAYDIDPKQDWIESKDTLNCPPIYTNKFILTNPPFLARNKTKEKGLFDKYKVNDLYKCFIKELIKQGPSGGILILPLNFWSSVRKMDAELRRAFLEEFVVDRVNVFEERVFEDTAYAVCSFAFKKSGAQSAPITFILFPSEETLSIYLGPKNNYIIGGELFTLPVSTVYKIDRLIGDGPASTNILVKCIDDSQTSQICAKFVADEEIFADKTKLKSARSYLTLVIEPALSEHAQRALALKFNEFLNGKRSQYGSLFLTHYRESNTIARKRISFDLVYRIVGHLLS